MKKDATLSKPSAPTKFKWNAHIQYFVFIHQHDTVMRGALVDRGENGGIAGDDLKIIATSDRKLDVSGIDNHELTGLKIVIAGGVVTSQRDKIVVIFHQFAYVPGGKTIILCPQLESFGIIIDNKSKVLKRGEQCITTLEGYVIPMNSINGLPYIPIRPFPNAEWNTLPHIILTSDMEWDPSFLDHNITNDDNPIEAFPLNPTNYNNSEN